MVSFLPRQILSVLYLRRINKVENEYLKYPPWVDFKKNGDVSDKGARSSSGFFLKHSSDPSGDQDKSDKAKQHASVT